MTAPKPPQKSLLARIFSIEGFLVLAGLALLVVGLATGEVIAIFWGVLALAGQVALYFVRKRDWQAHWASIEEQQRQQQKPKDEL
ncbi:MAG: hypothetical protein A2091_12800 [Desulfuromonadales bacterium GWD2_61_12]|nr:MAG: hypothetical protein A2005_11525 [Desulfuromonadales bacterium GWC2_61_20]OGR36560.1 MAG: hypothetical protein A2091_12800 [Desulfuromonadales bacterium GWD2_61_12]HAD05040.1 hypothetical protein [Desulfuromonas sp.]HBT83999.1 hypothetical protein [Desulfuromonas sp.]